MDPNVQGGIGDEGDAPANVAPADVERVEAIWDGIDPCAEGALVPFAPDGHDQLQSNASEVGVQAPFDWGALQIIETTDEEGRLKVATDEQLYVMLGLRDEDDRAENARKAAARAKHNNNTVPNFDFGVDSGALPVNDHIPNDGCLCMTKINLK